MNPRVRARGERLRLSALAASAASTMTVLGLGLATSAGEARAAAVSLTASGGGQSVRYGSPLRLAGRLGGEGGEVRLEHAPAGERWRAVAVTEAAADGTYSFSLRPRRSGSYRAVTEEGTSAVRRVAVLARLGGRAARHVRSGDRVIVRGRLAPGFGGRSVLLELATRRGWQPVDRARTGARGRFRAVWRSSEPGRFRLRLRFNGDGRNEAAVRRLRGRVQVYRSALVSWYGPGLYGNHLACGGTLGYGTLGVAHKWLPCDTRVTLRHAGRSVTVPVIDRGPYVGAREFDLTAATRSRLGFSGVGSLLVAH